MIISPGPLNGFSPKFVHIFYRKKYVPKKFLAKKIGAPIVLRMA